MVEKLPQIALKTLKGPHQADRLGAILASISVGDASEAVGKGNSVLESA